MNSARAARHNGFTLYVVLIVVTIGALTAGSVVYSAQAQRAAADAAARRVQSRAIAWSGVQAAMEAFRVQRDELIRGIEPDLPEDWSLFAEPSGRRAVARLVAGTDGRLLESESGKLDINTATEAMLALVPGLDAEVVKRIVATRGSRKFLSVHDLSAVEGLRGAINGTTGSEDEPASSDAFVPPEALSPSRPLTELLTVFSFEPNVQAGMGRNAESNTGVRRISLSGKWSERLGRAITDRFDEGASNLVKSLMEQGTKFEKESDIVKVLRRFNVEAKDWGEVLDAFCGDAGPYRLGRMDVLNAPGEMLACIPGIDASAAEQIVLRRSKLAPEQRLSLVWLVTENILTPDQFEQAADHLGTRSMQWRIVIEAGFVDGDSDEGEENPPLVDRVVVEAVLDVSSERPRVAYLREITMVEAARQLGPLRRVATVKEEEPEAVSAASPPGRAVSSSPATGRGSGSRPAARSQSPETGAEPSDANADGSAAAVEEKDPRLGRWTPGPQ